MGNQACFEVQNKDRNYMSPNFVCKEIEGTYLRESIHHSLQEHDKDVCNLVEYKHLKEENNFQKVVSPSEKNINNMGVQASGFKVKRQRSDKGNITSNSRKVNVFNLTQETRKQPNISNKRLCAGKNGKVNMPTRNNHCHQPFLSDEKGIEGFKIEKEDIANYVSSKDDLSQKEVNITEIQLKNTKSKTMTKERNELIIKNLIKKHLPKEIIEEAYESSFNNLDCIQDKEEAYFETLNKRQYVGTSSSAMLSINNPLSFVTEKRRLCDYQDPIFIELKFQQISNEIYDTRNPTTSITEFDHENLSRQQGTEPEYLNTEGFLSQLIN